MCAEVSDAAVGCANSRLHVVQATFAFRRRAVTPPSLPSVSPLFYSKDLIIVFIGIDGFKEFRSIKRKCGPVPQQRILRTEPPRFLGKRNSFARVEVHPAALYSYDRGICK